MSKHDLLTEQEFASYTPNVRIVNALEAFARASGRQPHELKVLDWGCGRGRDVLWLRERGYEAHGVDIDPLPVENGLPVFRSMGHPEDCLSLLDPDGRCSYPDGHFQFVFSGNVLEHVANIEGVCSEMARVTTPGGHGYHIFPAHRQPVEGHLFMPFVHWLPPNPLRKLAILLFVHLGREPQWIEVQGSSAVSKADFYYRYTLDHAFYRHYSIVRKVFEKSGFSVRFTTIDHPGIRTNPITARIRNTAILRRLLNHLLLTYKLVEMQVEKPRSV